MYQQQAHTSQQQQPQHNINQMPNQYQNVRKLDTRKQVKLCYIQSQMNDTAMEVDYSIPPHPQQHQQHQHQPQMHRDMQNNYEINVSAFSNSFLPKHNKLQDINPHEFDQYLQISNNETNRGVGSMVHHYQ